MPDQSTSARDGTSAASPGGRMSNMERELNKCAVARPSARTAGRQCTHTAWGAWAALSPKADLARCLFGSG
eukprot:1300994-Prymnesium_polylepis.2